MSREFVVTHPVTGELVKLVQGVVGFFDFPQDEATAEAVNRTNGNLERDLEIATTCSMFGWNEPLVGQLSNGECRA